MYIITLWVIIITLASNLYWRKGSFLFFQYCRLSTSCAVYLKWRYAFPISDGRPKGKTIVLILMSFKRRSMRLLHKLYLTAWGLQRPSDSKNICVPFGLCCCVAVLCCWSFILFDQFKRKLLLVVRHRGIMTMVCYESGQFREDFKFHMKNWKSGSRGSGGEFHMKEAVISVGWYAISLLDDLWTSAIFTKRRN